MNDDREYTRPMSSIPALNGAMHVVRTAGEKAKRAPGLAGKYLRQAAAALARRLGRREEPRCPSLLKYPEKEGPRICHVAFFESGNAGDVLLPVALRDLFVSQVGPIRWRNRHVHTPVDRRAVAAFNRSAGVIIGGGGLFLRDTNPNDLSGWQWSCSVDMLTEIDVPIALFAVGYNRFRGQPDFEPVFNEHVSLLAGKSVYLGLRNRGSIRAVREYLPGRLHHKLVFQPCATTLLAKLYPWQFRPPVESRAFVALNCAFDRASLRYGSDAEAVQRRIARAIARLNRDVPIKYYAHLRSDKEILPILDAAGVHYEVVDLAGASPQTIVEAYQQPLLSIGMRGHAQLIPFGCQTPILSLVSHDKLRWFLEDIHATDWAVEIQDADVEEQIYQKALTILSDREQVDRRLKTNQDRLWAISVKNAEQARQAMGMA